MTWGILVCKDWPTGLLQRNRSPLTCSGFRPVKQNMPIWSTMCCQLWEEPSFLRLETSWVRMLMMRSAMPFTSCNLEKNPKMELNSGQALTDKPVPGVFTSLEYCSSVPQFCFWPSPVPSLVSEESYFTASCFLSEHHFDQATKIADVIELLRKMNAECLSIY